MGGGGASYTGREEGYGIRAQGRLHQHQRGGRGFEQHPGKSY